LTLRRARLWFSAIRIEDVWYRVVAASSNPRAEFRGALNSVRSQDAAVIVAAGTGGTASGTSATYAPGAAEREAEAADGEDARIIALVNARRSKQGKPQLTAEQEEQVRANRRSEPHHGPAL
jgi:hypothetical protein